MPISSSHQFRTRFLHGEEIALGPGKVQLLEAIKRTGSISAAARAEGMSYRRAWLLIDTMNRCFNKPLVATAVGGKAGGGAEITPDGLAVVRAYRQLESAAERAAAREIRAIQTRLRGARAKSASAGKAVRKSSR